MQTDIKVSERFASFLTDWDYTEYLLIGGYGSGKSYHVALKLILKLMEEKRTALVVRQVKETIKDSCFALFKDILESMNMLSDTTTNKTKAMDGKVIAVSSPMEIRFPNCSKIIFRGVDNPEKLKSIHGVSMVWIEECSEVRYDAYTELLGRIRTPNKTLYTFLSCNPVGKENWVYNTFFTHLEENGETTVICDENRFYRAGTLVINGTYYHHSVPTDNPFLPKAYIERLDKLKMSDPRLWVVARWGRFGANGTRVLPQFEIARNSKQFINAVNSITSQYHFFGLDFGFETSYNALISCCVDDANKILYIYDEVYRNKITDDKFSNLESVHKTMERAEMCNKPICADSAKYLVLNHIKYWKLLRA